METLATRMMKKVCGLAMEMFKLEKKDLVAQVDDVLTAWTSSTRPWARRSSLPSAEGSSSNPSPARFGRAPSKSD
jgi:hypothetical protein